MSLIFWPRPLNTDLINEVTPLKIMKKKKKKKYCEKKRMKLISNILS